MILVTRQRQATAGADLKTKSCFPSPGKAAFSIRRYFARSLTETLLLQVPGVFFVPGFHTHDNTAPLDAGLVLFGVLLRDA